MLWRAQQPPLKTESCHNANFVVAGSKISLFHVGYSQQITLATKELLSDKDKNNTN